MKKQFVIILALMLVVSSLAGCGTKEETAAGGSAKRSYTIERTDGTPNWSNVQKLDIDNVQWLEPVDIKAHAQLCYNSDALFVHMWADEKNIRAKHQKTELLANIYEDSCLEFFIMPVSGDSRYMNFEFNPNCGVCAEIGRTKADRVRLVPSIDPFEAVSARTDTGWEITYKLPFAFIKKFYPDFSAKPGMQIAGNFYKCGNLTVKKHYISWNPIASDTPDFHRPQDFGVLIFK